MARKYTEHRDYEFADTASTFSAESVVRRVLTEAFSPLFGGVDPHFSMSTAEGYESTGADWDSVLAELTTDGLLPDRTYAALYPVDRRQMGSSPLVIMSFPQRHTVIVEISSEDEGTVRATAAKLDRLMAALVAGSLDATSIAHPLRAIDSPPTTGDTPSPSAHPVTPAGEVPAPIAPSPSSDAAERPERSWLARTWRDHAATLVITVVGTVLAAALLVVLNIGG